MGRFFYGNEKKGYVYILKDKNGKFYVGSTDNLERRLKQHKTDIRKQLEIWIILKYVLKQEYDSLDLARKIELKIKKLKRKDYIEKMINEGYIRMTI